MAMIALTLSRVAPLTFLTATFGETMSVHTERQGTVVKGTTF
jgi:hypothetical protein